MPVLLPDYKLYCYAVFAYPLGSGMLIPKSFKY
jgi:hypothetical protein